MPIPKTIKVGAHEVAVLRKPKKAMPLDEKGEPCLGLYDPDLQQIWIISRLSKSLLPEILMHEILHACTYPGMLEQGTDEEFITIMSPVLLQTLRDNPELVPFLKE